MLKEIREKLKKNLEIFALLILIIFTGISTSYFNYKKKDEIKAYNSFFFRKFVKK